MKKTQKFQVLRIYLDENLKWKNKLLYRAMVERLLKEKIAGATVFRAIEGYGSSARVHEAHILEMSDTLPVVVEVIDAPRQIQKALKAIRHLFPKKHLTTIQDVRVIRP